VRSPSIPRIAATFTVALALAALIEPVPAGRARDVRVQSFENLNEGVAAYNRGEFKLAVEKLRLSSAVALNSFRAYYYLGLALQGTRDYLESIDTLHIALDLDPNHLQAYVARGDAQLKLGDIDEARADYVRAMKLRPAHAPALDGLARSYEAQAKHDEAIKWFRQSIHSNKGFAPAYTHLGDLYMKMDLLQEAVRLLEEAVIIRPDYAPGLNRLALAYGRLMLTNEAVATIQRAIELEPRNPYHRDTLGRLQLGEGALGAAVVSFNEALGFEDNLPEARMGLAEVARRRGEYDAALVEIDTALAGEKLDASTVTMLTEFRVEIETEQTALAELEVRVAEDEASPDDYASLATIFASRRLWDRAVELQRNAPPLPAQQERLAFMLFQAGDYREAHGIYSRLATESEDTGLKLNDGITLAMLGDDEAAAEAYESVLDSDPTNLIARLYLGNALLRGDQPGLAAMTYKQYLDEGGEGEAAERVRRIIRQIAPDLLPPPPESPVPEEFVPRPMEDPDADEKDDS